MLRLIEELAVTGCSYAVVATCLCRSGTGGVPVSSTPPPTAGQAYWRCTPSRDNGGILPETAPYYIIREQTYRRVLGDALGDQLAYYSELFDRYRFPDPSYQSDDRRLSRAQVCRPDDQTADREWPGRGRSCGAVTGAARVSTADRVRRATTRGQFRNRPAIRIGGRYKESIDLALRVHPDTRHVFVVCGASPGMHGAKKRFARRCPSRRAWSSPSCVDTPCRR